MSPVQKELDDLQAYVDSKVVSPLSVYVPVCADIRSAEGCSAVAEAVRAQSERVLRVIVHNAGVNVPCKMMMQLNREEWSKVMDINMNGPLFLTQALYPLFPSTCVERNRILFMQTVAKMCTGLPNYGPYCVSKLGANGVALMFKEELSKANPPVYTATLVPGEVNTGMQEATAYSSSSGFPEHLVMHWRKLHETNQLLPPAVPAAFIEFVLCETSVDEFSQSEWFIYNKSHHDRWAREFSNISLEEPKGLGGDH